MIITTNNTKNRCKICNIKVYLNGWNCKCDLNAFFCDKHRLPFDHNCTIDFKKIHSIYLENNNIICNKEKINKI